MVAEKERLVTMHGGIQKCDVVAKDIRKEHKYSVYTAVLRHRRSARNGCVSFVPFTFNCQGHVALNLFLLSFEKC